MMKRLLTLMLASVTLLPALATTHETRDYMVDSRGRTTFWSKEGKKTLQTEGMRQSKRKAPAIAVYGGEPITLNIEMKYDKSKWAFDYLAGGMMDFSNFGSYEPINGPIEVPFGISSLMCVFRAADKDDFYVVAKDISDLKDGDKVVFDVEECVHKVRYEPLNEDGTPFMDSLAVKGSGSTMAEDGEFEYGFAYTILNNTKDGMLWPLVIPYLKRLDSNGQLTEMRLGDIYFNDCGPDFFMTQYILAHPLHSRTYTVIEMPVYVGSSSIEPSDTVLSNNPARYQVYTQEWTRSPYSVAQYDNLVNGCQIGFEINGISAWKIGGEQETSDCLGRDVETKLRVCSKAPALAGAEKASMLCIDMLPETDIDVQLGCGSWYWRPTMEGREYLPLNYQGSQMITMPFEALENFVEDNYDSWLLCYEKSNPVLAYDHSKALGRMGNNCPIISLLPGDYHFVFSSDFMPFYAGLVGRYGEGDMTAVDLIEEDNSYQYDQNGIRHDIFSYDNVLIDGEVEGMVVCDNAIKKGSGEEEDFVPPLLTYLGMKDQNGNLTDRFDTPEDGIVEFYGADFYFSFDWSLGEYGYPEYCIKPVAEATVEYAPYGTTRFTSLPVSMVPEKYYYPGWGDFFSVPLESVTGGSENGWFDLRITLKDESGNSQTQTISPAFKIHKLSGIAGVETDSNGEPRYYNLQGLPVANPENGIFIERQGTITRKVVK